MARRTNSIPWIIFARLTGLALFLIILSLMNAYSGSSDNRVFIEVLGFMNQSLGLIILFSAFFLIGEVVRALFFPLNLPAPIINALGGLYLLSFLFGMFGVVDRITGVDALSALEYLKPVAYPLVFIAVIIGGYASIFSDLVPKKERRRPEVKTEEKSSRTWQEIGDEFREMLYDAIRLAREDINKKRK
jgi:hypothetical protein